MDKTLYKLHADCGRAGTLYGLFIAEKSLIEKMIKDEINVYFGEVLGRHSEILGTLDDDDITLVTDDAFALDMIVGLDLEFGFNPLDQEFVDEAPDGFEGETVRQLVEYKIINNL